MKTEYNSKLIYVIAVVAATGGLLFGFDTGVISGAIPFFQKDFGIDNGMIEIITASGLCGAILGALFCGKVTDTLGRRKVILASAVVFAIGALWSGFAPDVYHLIASRLFLGVAIGVSSFAVPLYIAEISPAKKRGALVSMFQLMVTIGVLVSYLSDLFFADESRIDCWRPMFYVGVIPAIVLFVGMLCMPETRLSRTVQALAAQCRDHLHRNYVFPTVCRHQYRDLLQSQDIPYGRVRRYGFRYMGLGGRRGGQPAVHDRIGVFCRQAWKAQTLFHRSDRDHGFADSVGHLLCLLRFVGRCRQMVVRPVGLFLCCLFRYQHRPVGVAYHLRSISPETQGIGLIHRFLVRVVFQ